MTVVIKKTKKWFISASYASLVNYDFAVLSYNMRTFPKSKTLPQIGNVAYRSSWHLPDNPKAQTFKIDRNFTLTPFTVISLTHIKTSYQSLH